MRLGLLFFLIALVGLLSPFVPHYIHAVGWEFALTLLAVASMIALFKSQSMLVAKLKVGEHDANALLFSHVKSLVARGNILLVRSSWRRFVGLRGVRVIDVLRTFRELQPPELQRALLSFSQLGDEEVGIYIVQKKVPVKREDLIPSKLASAGDIAIAKLRFEMFSEMLSELGEVRSLETLLIAVAVGSDEADVREKLDRGVKIIRSKLDDLGVRAAEMRSRELIELASLVPCLSS